MMCTNMYQYSNQYSTGLLEAICRWSGPVQCQW